MDGTHREMPRYKCHKEVWALKIARIDGDPADGNLKNFVIHPADEGYGLVEVPRGYVYKHRPKPGGYYVVYEDGYQSYSPAEPFEKGYTRIK